MTSLERAKKIDDLEKRLVESEMLRMRFSRKVTVLKEQVWSISNLKLHLANGIFLKHKTPRFVFQLKSTSDCHNQDKTLNEHTMRVLQDDLSSIKFQLSEVKRRECSVSQRLIFSGANMYHYYIIIFILCFYS